MILKQPTILLGIFLINLSAHAQQASTTSSPPQPVRDTQAITVVQQGLSVMGGTAAIAQVQNSVVTGTSVDPTTPETTPGNFSWTYAGNQFRLADSAATGSHVLVSSGGSPQDFHDGSWFSVSPILARTNLAYHIPALVLFSEIQNSGYSFIFIGSATLNGKAAIHIQSRDDSDTTGHLFTPQDWYFDPVTALPLCVEYQIPISQNPSDSLQASMSFSNFQAINGILVPFQLGITEGPVSFVATVTSAAFNTSISSSGFAPSAGDAQ
jgi:hypothetical protein